MPKIGRQKRAWISAKIRLLRHEGYAPKQAVAIAYSMAGISSKKAKLPGGAFGSRDFDKPALLQQIAKDHRRADKAKIANLRGELSHARKSWPKTRAKAKASCSASRAKTSAEIKKLRALTRAKTNARADALRAKTRMGCAASRSSYQAEVARLKRALVEERRYQLEIRRLTRASAANKRKPPSARERLSESDDEVRGNIPADLIPLFNKIRRGIKPGPRKSRTEAFLQYVEEHPSDRYAGSEDATDAIIRAHERRLRTRSAHPSVRSREQSRSSRSRSQDRRPARQSRRYYRQ